MYAYLIASKSFSPSSPVGVFMPALHGSRSSKFIVLPSRVVLSWLRMSRPRSASWRLALMTSTIWNLKLLNWRFTKYVYFLSSRPSKDITVKRPAGMSLSLLIACCGSTVMSAPVSIFA